MPAISGQIENRPNCSRFRQCYHRWFRWSRPCGPCLASRPCRVSRGAAALRDKELSSQLCNHIMMQFHSYLSDLILLFMTPGRRIQQRISQSTFCLIQDTLSRPSLSLQHSDYQTEMRYICWCCWCKWRDDAIEMMHNFAAEVSYIDKSSGTGQMINHCLQNITFMLV